MKQLVWMALISVMSICAQQQQPPPLARGYVSQIASGGGWKTTLTLFNTTSAQTQVAVFFRADDGSPLSLPLVITQAGTRQTGTAPQVGLTIQPLATLVIESEAPAGSSTVTGSAEVLSRTRIPGSAIFRQQGPDGRTVEAIAPVDYGVSASIVVPFDNRDGAATGIALVNPTERQINLIMRSRNENGVELDQSRLMLPPEGHTAFVIAERVRSLAGQQGTIEFMSPGDERFSGLGLRFSATGGFTSVPVLQLREPLPTRP